MDHLLNYIWLLCIIIIVGLAGRRIAAPTPLLLVIAGMLLSYLPGIPIISLQPDIILTIFLPLLVYEASTYTSWPEIKRDKRAISLLTIGHVIFITLLVAYVAHTVIPGLSWPVAFVLGAIISPPDDVAIFAIAEKVSIPKRLLTILMGEGLLNDATALIIFKYALAAVITHYFSPVNAILDFIAILVLETAYGLLIGNLIGQIRLRLNEPMLQMLMSLMTPFIAFIPAAYVGGSGVLATVVAGMVIGHSYIDRLTPGARILWHSVWETIGFTFSSILFLLVGLDFNNILGRISHIPMQDLAWYGLVVTLTVIIGRFIFVFPSTYLPRILFKKIREQDPSPPWQYPFIISWAGMRGGISLAAALIFPAHVAHIDGTDMRDLLIFLVFCVITATLLLQGLSLPWLLKKLGADVIGDNEKHHEYYDELTARSLMSNAALHWLREYEQTSNKGDKLLAQEIAIQKMEYEALNQRIHEKINAFDHQATEMAVTRQSAANEVISQIIEVERDTLAKLWRDGMVTLNIRNNLLQQLDLLAKRYSG